ncbi:hypothetical protein WELLINGTON_110 [Erwinia phage Wellington]|uniref:Uncharacterized protein n=1 Tax=Erwinia phage Wellington TaxID=2267653 RepID=A0A345BLB9_9CAUD|nr:hypothetical protein HOT70_gp191 [Erwinia phage Wellington]AXF51240.1 hypothetical protein WELLINGTON_110 [Erwinia phage Wellington]
MRSVLAVLLLLVFSQTAHADFNPSEMLGYQPNSPDEPKVKFEATDRARTVAEGGDFAVVNFGKTDTCPGGGFYLVNTKRKIYQFIDAGSCYENVRADLSTPPTSMKTIATQVLTFYIGKTIIARYPLYGY